MNKAVRVTLHLILGSILIVATLVAALLVSPLLILYFLINLTVKMKRKKSLTPTSKIPTSGQ
ncbi:hypothetical protein CLV98_104150 [Dyadobacter jejuensis]|uniref:Uncharacterized protein n=1 Tax=Dyadobacter jejuensis TaxID=1082580 RepID=A0A316ALA1_9BACT|nr:hypothetical protein [Dyadobacter jejuensis]PWJ58292.1 hypothetical protein CLV98_104150 [Dyadobacter jejuensis]